MSVDLHVLEGLPPEDEKVILDRLKSFNVATFGESDREELAILLYDEDGGVAGGLVGFTGRGWLYVRCCSSRSTCAATVSRANSWKWPRMRQ